MKRKFFVCLVSLAGVIIQAAPVMAITNTTEITGSVPLIIYEVSTSNISYQGATISWKTNNDATSQVCYDTVYHQDIGDYVYHTDVVTALVSGHSVNLTGLSPVTTYHYRVLSGIPGTGFTDISDDYTFTTLASPGGSSGGGGGGGGGGGITPVYEVMAGSEFVYSVTAKSTDQKVAIDIPKGTSAKTETGRFTSIFIKEQTVMPDWVQSWPQYTKTIGAIYNISPEGVTFEPPIDLTIRYDWYDESLIPRGVDERNLVIETYDVELGKWVPLESEVDPEKNTVTAKTSHFSLYTIMAHTAPASFTVGDLSISPGEISPGMSITINTLVTNNGDLTGNYGVALRINDEILATQEVTLAGDQSGWVTFTREIKEAGVYTVAIDDQSITFEVKMTEPAEPAAPVTDEVIPAEPVSEPTEPVAAETTPAPTLSEPVMAETTPTPTPPPAEGQPLSTANWWLIGGIIAAVMVIAEAFWLKLGSRGSINIKKR